MLLCSRSSAPMLFLLEARRGGKSGLQILPTLLIEDENGAFSKEMLEIYGEYKTDHEETKGSVSI